MLIDFSNAEPKDDKKTRLIEGIGSFMNMARGL